MKTLFVLLLCVPVVSLAHQGKQAFYRMFEQNGVLWLTVKMELPDVEFCLNNEDVCQPETQVYWCAAQWISDHISLTINGELRISKFSESRTDDGHLLLTFELGDVPEFITSLDVKNDCFLNSFPQYENLFQVAVRDLNQGYLMNKDRTNISINPTDRP